MNKLLAPYILAEKNMMGKQSVIWKKASRKINFFRVKNTNEFDKEYAYQK